MSIVQTRASIILHTKSRWNFTAMLFDLSGEPISLLGGRFEIPVKRSLADTTPLFTYATGGAQFSVEVIENAEILDPVRGAIRGDMLSMEDIGAADPSYTMGLPSAVYCADVYRLDDGTGRLTGFELNVYRGV